jgi:hypothetical protein
MLLDLKGIPMVETDNIKITGTPWEGIMADYAVYRATMISNVGVQPENNLSEQPPVEILSPDTNREV